MKPMARAIRRIEAALYVNFVSRMKGSLIQNRKQRCSCCSNILIECPGSEFFSSDCAFILKVSVMVGEGIYQVMSS